MNRVYVQCRNLRGICWSERVIGGSSQEKYQRGIKRRERRKKGREGKMKKGVERRKDEERCGGKERREDWVKKKDSKTIEVGRVVIFMFGGGETDKSTGY